MSRSSVPSHVWPRSRSGRRLLLLFVSIMALAQPPLVWWIANRIAPRILGMPFLYVWLLVVYVALIGVLVRAWRRGL